MDWLKRAASSPHSSRRWVPASLSRRGVEKSRWPEVAPESDGSLLRDKPAARVLLILFGVTERLDNDGVMDCRSAQGA
jgi:hypothetical protein